MSKIATIFKNIFNKIKNFSSKINKKTFFIALIWIFVGFFIVSISLWINLPSSKLNDKLTNYLNSNLPDNYSVSIGNLTNKVTGIDLNNIRINTPNNIIDYIIIDDVNISFLSIQIFKLAIPINIKLYNSQIDSSFNLTDRSIIIHDSKINLAFIPQIRKLDIINGTPELNIYGTFSATTINGNWTLNEFTINTNNNNLINIPFNVPDDILFNSLNGNFDLSVNPLQNIDVEFTGDLNGTLNTKIQFNQNYNNSNYTFNINTNLSDKIISDDNDIISLFLNQYLDGNSLKLLITFNAANFKYDIQKLQ